MTRAAIALAALAFAVPVGAVAAERTFSGPAGWEHPIVGTAGAGGEAHSNDVWRKKDGQTLALLHDPAQTMVDVLAAVKKNADAGNITIVAESDRPCAGKTAHIIDIVTPEPKMAIRQMLLPDAPGTGNVRVTYTHADKQTTPTEVTAAIDAFCSGT